jgi:hypothetical protein
MGKNNKKLIPIKNYDYSGKNLSGKNFSNTVLIGVDFSDSKCNECNFSGADLSFAVFKGAELYKANFKGAVLYCTRFENCNLTKADFDEACIFGIKFFPYVDVTYSSFKPKEIRLEKRQRTEDRDGVNYEQIELCSSVKKLNSYVMSGGLDNDSPKYFCCNGYYFRTWKYDKDQKNLDMSKIFNSLKRIFNENNFEKDAAKYYFQEMCYLTKSRHKNCPGKDLEEMTFERIYKTIFSKTVELICGYGERPLRVVGWILGGWIVWSLWYCFFGIFEQPLTLSDSLYCSICNLVSFGSSDMKPLGWTTKILAISQSVYGVIFLAILTATMVRKMMRD